MKVRILVSIASPDWAYAPGEVVELPAEQAQAWVDAGLAEAVEQPAPQKKKPAKE